MKYRVVARNYITYGRPMMWQSAGLYDYADAVALAARLREPSDMSVGADAWLVPL